MAAIIGNDIGMKLLEALGITDKRVRAIDIRIETGKPVMVTVERRMESEDAEVLVNEFKKYAVVEKEAAIGKEESSC
jgi:hypothetical protein